jgi:hypothetical protein
LKVNDSQNSLQGINNLNDGGSTVGNSSLSAKMKAMVANLVDSSKTSGSVKNKMEFESDRVSTLNEEIFEGTTGLISDIQFRQKHNEFIIECLHESDETAITNQHERFKQIFDQLVTSKLRDRFGSSMIEHFYASFFSELTPKHETEKETSQVIAEMLDINAFRIAMNLRKEFHKEDLEKKKFK